MPAFRPVPPSFSAARAAAAARPRMVPNARPVRSVPTSAVIPQGSPKSNPNKTLPVGFESPETAAKMAAMTPKPAMGGPSPGMPSQGIGNTNMTQKSFDDKAADAYKTYKAGETRNGVTAPTMPSPGMSSPNMAPKPTTLSPGGPNAFPALGMKRGGAVKTKQPTKFASGGSVSSASKRGDGIAQRGKTKGKMC